MLHLSLHSVVLFNKCLVVSPGQMYEIQCVLQLVYLTLSTYTAIFLDTACIYVYLLYYVLLHALNYLLQCWALTFVFFCVVIIDL